MDGVLSPVYRKKRKYICCDLYSSAITILITEVSLCSGWIVYYSIMLWSYYDNGGITTINLVAEEKGDGFTKPLIPNDVMYCMLLVGFGFCLVICFLLFLGTVWLYSEFLQLWTRGIIISNVYFLIVLLMDWVFSRYVFPVELLILPFRSYFVILITAFRKQIAEDADHDYDYKKFAEEHELTYGVKLVDLRKETRWGRAWRQLCAIAGLRIRKRSRVVPVQFNDRKTVIRNMCRDLDLEYTPVPAEGIQDGIGLPESSKP